MRVWLGIWFDFVSMELTQYLHTHRGQRLRTMHLSCHPTMPYPPCSAIRQHQSLGHNQNLSPQEKSPLNLRGPSFIINIKAWIINSSSNSNRSKCSDHRMASWISSLTIHSSLCRPLSSRGSQRRVSQRQHLHGVRPSRTVSTVDPSDISICDNTKVNPKLWQLTS